MAEDEGWSIGDPFITSDIIEDKEAKIESHNQTALTFIYDSIIPLAKKAGKNLTVLHQCHVTGTVLRLCDIDIANPKPIKKDFTFVIGSGNYGKVLSFNPTYTGMQAASMKVNAGYVDRETNQFMLFKNNPDLGKNIPDNIEVFGATSPEAFNSKIQSMWFDTNVGVVEATMEIIGDPDINPMDYVNVIPIRPDGRPHHSAGTYFVNQVVDTVDTSFKTQLTMKKMPGTKTSPIVAAYESGWKNS